ncbi:MAG: alpha/beta hydrolase [Actinomycetota bacterium]|nr:alpha/beta hydrolase [Actinomycetota bacterium]
MSEGQLPDVVLRYADRTDAVVDLHLPDGAASRRHVVVLLHGGFWKVEWDRTHTRPLARELAEDGWVVATPEYRRVGRGPGGGGGWPTTCADVHDAVSALPRLVAERGVGAEPIRLVVAGHSAGGHLALWLASSDLPIERVVPLAPVADLREAARLGLGAHATQAFMGGEPEQVDYRPADPVARFGVLRPRASVRILHGTADDVVPVSVSRSLQQAHPWVQLEELEGIDHFEVIEPTSSAYAALRDALEGS